MKKFAYLLMALMLLSGLSMNAQNYGKPYRSPYSQQQSVYGYSQVPTVTMRSTSALSGSGSALPQAAITGTYTADQIPTTARIGRLRRIGGSGFADDDDENPEDKDNTPPVDPGDNVPLGDAMWPMMVLALACGALIYLRRRKTVKG